MTATVHSWEHSLLRLAHEGWQAAKQQPFTTEASATDLVAAYLHCEQITAEHSRSFHLASRLLPPEKRRATRALYAFCRMTDDLVDEPDEGADLSREERLGLLKEWQTRAFDPAPSSDDALVLAWADARARFHIPQRYAEQLIDGVAQDLTHSGYQTFADLTGYCYGVASTVGLMSMHIVGYRGAEAIPYAVKLGVALQMTNILRDVMEDWRNGRLYLPREELDSFGIAPEEIGERVDYRWREFMRFQIARNRQLYAEAWPGIGLLARDGRFSIAAAADLYRQILNDIENHGYDNLSRRAYISKWQKLSRLPGIWWSSRRFPVSI